MAAETTDPDLPPGVEPWEGDDMPTGRVSVQPAPILGDLEESEELGVAGAVGEGLALAAEGDAEDEPTESIREADQGLLVREGEHKKIFESAYAALSVEQRAQAARSARGGDLLALCFDGEPRVIAALTENPEFGFLPARTVARHHKNARGLEILTRHRQLLADAEVARRLLQNTQAPAEVVMRILGPKRLRDVYKLCVDRELPEHVRSIVRGELRKKFATAESEERADLVLRTEGRCLVFLVGATFDGRMTQILCGKNLASSLLIGNLARFSATPPPLLMHLLKNPVVRRQPQLKNLVLKHPNLPSEGKRGAM